MRPGFASKIRVGNRPIAPKQVSSEPAIYEVRGSGVKPNRSASCALLAGAGGVGLQRADALGERAAAAVGWRGLGRIIGRARRGDGCGGGIGGQNRLDRRIRSFEL